LLLGQPLPLHVRPDLLGHLRRPDGLAAHDRLERVVAALEVDRVAAERRLLFGHSPFLPRGLVGVLPGAPRNGRGYYGRTPRERKAKNTIPRGSPRGRDYPVGVYPRGVPSPLRSAR